MAWDEYKNITVNGCRYYGKHMMLTCEACNDNLLSVDTMKEFLKEFNRILSEKLTQLMEAPLPKASFWKNPFYYIGRVVNFPVNFLAESVSRKVTRGSVFFDSITGGIVMFILPVYWLLLALIVYFLTKIV